MRHFSALAVVIFTGLAAPARAADDSARDIIDGAMKACCEQTDRLEKQRCEVIAMRGTMYLADPTGMTDLAATGEIRADWPSSFRWDRKFMLKGPTRSDLAIHGDHGWMRTGAQAPAEMEISRIDEVRMEAYGRWLITLYPLKQKSFTLTALKDSMVGNESARVVKVTARLRPDVYMYVGVKTRHLLKVAYNARESGIECRKEHILSDFKLFDGLMLPAKIVDTIQPKGQSARKGGEWTITSYKFPEKLEPEIFELPKEK